MEGRGGRRGRAKDSPHNRLLGPHLFTKKERKTQTVRQEGMGDQQKKKGRQERRREERKKTTTTQKSA